MTIAYMTAVSQIVDRGRNTNSYKFALLRALAAFGKQPGSGAVTVSREWLAERFIEFYWPITLRFQIRQATVPDKDPVVMRLIRAARSELKFSPETRLKDFRKRHPDRNKKPLESTLGH